MVKRISADEKDRRYEAALRLESLGNYADALELYGTWYAEAEDTDEKLIYLAGIVNCLNWLGRNDEALSLVENTAKLKPKSDQAAFTFGLSIASSYLSKGDFEKSSQVYLDLLNKYREYLSAPDLRWVEVDTRIRYVSVLIQLKRAREARHQLLRLIQQSDDPEQIGMAKIYLGACDYLDGDTESAINSIEAGLKHLKELRNQVEAHFYLGGAYFRAQKFSLAFDEFKFCKEHQHTGAISSELIDEMYAYALTKTGPSRLQ